MSCKMITLNRLSSKVWTEIEQGSIPFNNGNIQRVERQKKRSNLSRWVTSRNIVHHLVTKKCLTLLKLAWVAVLSFSSERNKRTKASEKKPEQKNTGERGWWEGKIGVEKAGRKELKTWLHLIGLLTLVRRSCELIQRCQIFISQRLSTKIKVYAKPFVSLASPSKHLKGLVRMLLTFDLTFDRC